VSQIDLIMSVFEYLFMTAGFFVGWYTTLTIIHDRTARYHLFPSVPLPLPLCYLLLLFFDFGVRFAIDFGLAADVERGGSHLPHPTPSTPLQTVRATYPLLSTTQLPLSDAHARQLAAMSEAQESEGAGALHPPHLSSAYAGSAAAGMPAPALSLRRDSDPQPPTAPHSLFSPDSRSAALALARTTTHRSMTQTRPALRSSESGVEMSSTQQRRTFTFSRAAPLFERDRLGQSQQSVEQVIANIMERTQNQQKSRDSTPRQSMMRDSMAGAPLPTAGNASANNSARNSPRHSVPALDRLPSSGSAAGSEDDGEADSERDRLTAARAPSSSAAAAPASNSAATSALLPPRAGRPIQRRPKPSSNADSDAE
jgi:hypothetical protein